MNTRARRLAIAIATSATIVFATPYIGQLRSTIRRAFPDQFVIIIAAAIGLLVGASLLLAFVRIRDRRLSRYLALISALALGVAYSSWSRTGIPEVDVVERVHFVEYGLITLLFYRVWHQAGDASVVIAPAIAALIVGTCEEWLQWFIPARVGEIRDIFLNGWAVVCGLLFSIGLDPPASLKRMQRHSWSRIGWLGAAFVLALAVFIDSVHLGHRIDDPVAGVFRSRYTSEELAELTRLRSASWSVNPPLTWSRLSREDQYMTEGVVRVQHRNEAWQAGDVATAWHENLILERYFAPVLDTPSYISATGHRWSTAHRLDAERRYVPGPARYQSDAEDPPIFTWSRSAFWALTIPLVLLLILLAVRNGGASNPPVR